MSLSQDSISKDLTPYWNESCRVMSLKLLSQTKTACVGSDLNLLNPLQGSSISWFSMKVSCHHKENLSKTSYQSYTHFLANYADLENTVVRSKKVRIYPKDPQQARKYLGLSRWWYNRTIHFLKQPTTKASLYEVRKVLQKGVDIPEWAMDCPQRIREHAMSDACLAVKNAKLKYKKTQQYQEVAFRAKRDLVQSFGFDAKSLGQDFVFGSQKFKLGFKATEVFQTDLEGTRVVREGSRYFVIVPQRVSYQQPENQRIDTVSLDPGVRTFMTFYSEVLHGKIGEGDFQRIYRLCLHLDRLMSSISKAGCKRRRRLKKAAERMHWRVYDLIEDLHKKLANYLVRTFNRILIPVFETSQMVTQLVSRVSRSMLTFGHYRFKEYLKARGQQAGCEVLEVNEAYTSKTCSYCGVIHRIGSQRRMKCGCGVDVDRDLNGARGIYLRALAASP